MRELHLFAGAGGGILGGILLGHTCVCAVEIEPYCRKVLLQRQRDGILPKFPIWDDVRTFDGRPWRGLVDAVRGGFPCQDISAIGKGAGIDGARSGLWGEMARVIGEILPPIVELENSPLLVKRGLARVLSDLAKMGYDATWGIIGADDAGFPHHRARLWLVGESHRSRLQRHSGHGEGQGRRSESYRPTSETGLRLGRWKRVVYAADCDEDGNCPVCRDIDFSDCECPGPTMDEYQYCRVGEEMWARPRTGFVEPGLERVAYGVADRVDRLKAIGNGQVPSVAALAWRTLSGSSVVNGLKRSDASGASTKK